MQVPMHYGTCRYEPKEKGEKKSSSSKLKRKYIIPKHKKDASSTPFCNLSSMVVAPTRINYFSIISDPCSSNASISSNGCLRFLNSRVPKLFISKCHCVQPSFSIFIQMLCGRFLINSSTLGQTFKDDAV